MEGVELLLTLPPLLGCVKDKSNTMNWYIYIFLRINFRINMTFCPKYDTILSK